MIYLDNNATTCPLPEVVRAVADAMERYPGNPSSIHAMGMVARQALESAREDVATHFRAADVAQVVFTSSGTESINTAFCLLGGARVLQFVISTVEHSSVSHAASRWASGRAICRVPVSSDGALDLERLSHSLAARPSLVSVALANNETGIVTDVRAVARLCRQNGALLHIDAVQAVGKMPFRLDEMDCDAASLSAHKFHGPRGCGVLFLRSKLPPDVRGHTLLTGHQERGLRGGTENLPAAVGAAVASKAMQNLQPALARLAELRDSLEKSLLASIPGSEIHGRDAPRLANTTSLFCPHRSAADLVLMLSQMGVAVSSGAACTTGGTPSHVIQAMGFSQEQANSTLRLSLSRFTTAEEVREAGRVIANVYSRTLASESCR